MSSMSHLVLEKWTTLSQTITLRMTASVQRNVNIIDCNLSPGNV